MRTDEIADEAVAAAQCTRDVIESLNTTLSRLEQLKAHPLVADADLFIRSQNLNRSKHSRVRKLSSAAGVQDELSKKGWKVK